MRFQFGGMVIAAIATLVWAGPVASRQRAGTAPEVKSVEQFRPLTAAMSFETCLLRIPEISSYFGFRPRVLHDDPLLVAVAYRRADHAYVVACSAERGMMVVNRVRS